MEKRQHDHFRFQGGWWGIKLHQMHGTQRSSRSGGKGYVFLWAVLSWRCLGMSVKMDKALGVISAGKEVVAMAKVKGVPQISETEVGTSPPRQPESLSTAFEHVGSAVGLPGLKSIDLAHIAWLLCVSVSPSVKLVLKNRIYFIGLLGGVNKVISMKLLEFCLAHSKHSMNSVHKIRRLFLFGGSS